MSSDHARPTARRRARPTERWARPAAFSLLLAVLAGVTGLPASASAAPAGTVEGEQLTPDKGVIASTYRDTNASGGAVFGLWSSGAASTTVSTPALGSLAVRAKADLCNGAPTLELWVDGELVLSTPVGSTSWATYGVNGSWPAGSHRIGVAFPNDARTSGCDRNLKVDTLGLDTATVGGYPQALPPARPQPTGNPFATLPLFVDPKSPARAAADAARASDPTTAGLLDLIANRPQTDWLGSWLPARTLAGTVAARVRTIRVAGALPVFVVYNIPHRDCGGYSGGGAPDAAAYRDWINQLAAGLAGSPAVVLLEPDSLTTITCLSSTDQQERYQLLQEAVTTLTNRPGVTVYLDAGHARWVPTEVMAARLRAAGIDRARGFALNVSGFQWLSDEAADGDALAVRLGSKHFVVDTSRNGLGPASGPVAWCNPVGRALGAAPTAATGDVYADAFLWVKHPGLSDGTCGRGDPPAGQWWTAYAVGLAQRSR